MNRFIKLTLIIVVINWVFMTFFVDIYFKGHAIYGGINSSGECYVGYRGTRTVVSKNLYYRLLWYEGISFFLLFLIFFIAIWDEAYEKRKTSKNLNEANKRTTSILNKTLGAVAVIFAVNFCTMCIFTYVYFKVNATDEEDNSSREYYVCVGTKRRTISETLYNRARYYDQNCASLQPP